MLSQQRYANCLSSLRAYLRDPSAGAVGAPDASLDDLDSFWSSPLVRRFMEHQHRLEIRVKALNVLAAFHRDQGHYGEAEPLYKAALAIKEMNFGRDDPAVVTSLCNLGNR